MAPPGSEAMEHFTQFDPSRMSQAEIAAIMTALLSIGIAVLVAIIVTRLLFALVRRIVRRTTNNLDNTLVAVAERPLRWSLTLVAINSVLPGLSLDPAGTAIASRVLALATTACLGWLLVALVRGVTSHMRSRYDITASDNLEARRVQTRATILERVFVGLIVLVTVCLMLMSFPAIRHIGVTMFASAGLAALAIGAAAQPLLKNVIAGLQLAFTEPIRLDGVVIWDGEFARVEEIRLTFVVLRTWDERRLIVPVSKFLEDTFQNWTHSSAELMGTVFLQLDYAAPIDVIRSEAERLIKAHELWDKRVAGAQVTEFKDRVVELRVLMSAKTSGELWDLRCAVREGLVGFVRDKHPEALPRIRAALAGEPDASAPIRLQQPERLRAA